MNAVFAVVILGAVAAASAAAVAPGTSVGRSPLFRRPRQVFGVNMGSRNFSPTVNGHSLQNGNSSQHKGISGNPVYGVNFGDGNFSPNVSLPVVDGSSANAPSSRQPPVLAPSGSKPTASVPTIPFQPGNIPVHYQPHDYPGYNIGGYPAISIPVPYPYH